MFVFYDGFANLMAKKKNNQLPNGWTIDREIVR